MKQSVVARQLRMRTVKRCIGTTWRIDPVCGEYDVPKYESVLQVLVDGKWVDVPTFDEQRRRYEA